jgi:hypothetical protein
VAIASVGSLGTGAASVSGTTLAFSPTAQLDAGNTGVLVVVSDNVQTTDGQTSLHGPISDTIGLQWAKLGEYTNGQGAAAGGITTSLWTCRGSANLPTTATVTLSFASAVVDRTCTFWEFSGGPLDLSTAVAVNATDGANGFGSSPISGLPSKSRLYIRGLGKEANSTTQITPSTSFTAMTVARSRNNASAVLARGEFRINTSTGETSNPTLAVIGDTAAVFAALEETFRATGSVTMGGFDVAGTGTFQGLNVSGSAALTMGGMEIAGAATFVLLFTGSGSVSMGPFALSAAGETSLGHPVGILTRSVAGLPQRRVVTFSGKVMTPPVYESAGTLTMGGFEMGGAATVVYEHPVGILTRSVAGLWTRRTESFANKGQGVIASAGITLGGFDLSGTGTVQPPVYTASANVTLGGFGVTSAGTVQVPVYSGEAEITLGGFRVTASAAVQNPTYTAEASVTLGGFTVSGTGIFAANVYSAFGSATLGAFTLSGSGATDTPPVATGSLTFGGFEFSGAATFEEGVPSDITDFDILWELPSNRLHYSVPVNRLHYELPA